MAGHLGPLHVREGLRAYADAVKHLLGSNLLGIYLYGSVAGGCSNGKTSDVDVVVVLHGPILRKTVKGRAKCTTKGRVGCTTCGHAGAAAFLLQAPSAQGRRALGARKS